MLDTIEISINGQVKQIPSSMSVAALLTRFDIRSERVAIELNKVLVRKRDWENTVVSPGAQVEVVEFVGGG